MSSSTVVVVEVTNTLSVPYTTGYQRVVREVLRGLDGPAGHDLDVVPVVRPLLLGDYRRLTEGEAERLRRHPPGGHGGRRSDRFGLLAPVVRGTLDLPVTKQVRGAIGRARGRRALTPEIRALTVPLPEIGSIWLDLEPTWHNPEPRTEVLPRMRAAGIHTAVLVADVMPERFPRWFDPEKRTQFSEWLRAHLRDSEMFLCISERTAADLRSVARQLGAPDPETVVVPLGADFPVEEPQPVDLPDEVGRYLLVVGTLEPRKNQQVVLDAFDVLSRRHPDLGVVLVGKQGWLVDDLVDRVRAHPEFGRRLLWLEGIDDAELAWLYQQAFLAVAPSKYEGLGVPVMEALHHGCATLSSDGGALPEAGGERVTYFSPDDVDALCVLVERHLLDPGYHQAAVDRAAGWTAPTWAATAQAVGDALRTLGGRTPPLVPGGSGGHR